MKYLLASSYIEIFSGKWLSILSPQNRPRSLNDKWEIKAFVRPSIDSPDGALASRRGPLLSTRFDDAPRRAVRQSVGFRDLLGASQC